MCLEKTIFDDLYLKLNKKQEKHQNICKIAIIVQQTFVSLEHVLKTSSTHVLKTVSRRLQRNNFTSSKTSWRRLEDILQDVLKTSCKTSWRRLGRRKIVTLKTSWRRLEDMSWRRLEDMSWRCLEDMSWRRLEDIMETSKVLTGDICI